MSKKITADIQDIAVNEKSMSGDWVGSESQEESLEDWKKLSNQKLEPTEIWYGYPIRPGFYNQYGAHPVEGGVSFTIHSEAASDIDLLLFNLGEEEPFAIIPFPQNYRVGDVHSMIVFGIDAETIEYAFSIDGPWDPDNGYIFDKTKAVVDQYAKRIEVRTDNPEEKYPYRARIQVDTFDWGTTNSPKIPQSDMIIYETHVGSFTKHPSSGVKNPGTYDGLLEKIPHLKSLGVNVIELLPVFKFDPNSDRRYHNGNELVDYWGYNPVGFYALHDNYNSQDYGILEGYELKKLVKVLHENGMEIILDVVFNHTVEGNEHGPYINFKGIDNQVYYMLTPEGYYWNFSGTGNTLNCNHPVVRNMILDCLRYWVTNYHIDGFRFDLASIMGRDENGYPLSNPPLLESLAHDPILKNVELIAEAWDAGGLYQVGSFPAYTRWGEWNGRYRDSMRRFLKGDSGNAYLAAQSLTGSRDIYPQDERGNYASVNFITCHDGFTLRDLYSYNEKHNDANGWNNTDGTNDNFSWNAGVEGDTDDPEVLRLRQKLTLNAVTTLLSSIGIPMILAGDEFGNTQFGNNNPYCQDNEISWLNWDLLEENQKLFNFYKDMIAFRKRHAILRGASKPPKSNYPETSIHGHQAWNLDTSEDSRYVGVLYAGRNVGDTQDELIYLAVNAHWEEAHVELPKMPHGEYWLQIVNTDLDWEENFVDNIATAQVIQDKLVVPPRTVILLEANPTSSHEEAVEQREKIRRRYLKNKVNEASTYTNSISRPVKTGSMIPWRKSLEQLSDDLESAE